MQVVWYVDRAAALVTYPALYLAVLTGIFYNARGFGWLTDAARRVHVEVAVFATVVTLLHAAVGVLDTWLVLDGQVPHPAYSTAYLLAGVAVGAGALFLLVVSVLGFLDARRFSRPWGPRVVHMFAYGAFVFGTVHAAAVGTDVTGVLQPLLGAGTAFLVYALLVRALVANGVLDPASASGQ